VAARSHLAPPVIQYSTVLLPRLGFSSHDFPFPRDPWVTRGCIPGGSRSQCRVNHQWQRRGASEQAAEATRVGYAKMSCFTWPAGRLASPRRPASCDTPFVYPFLPRVLPSRCPSCIGQAAPRLCNLLTCRLSLPFKHLRSLWAKMLVTSADNPLQVFLSRLVRVMRLIQPLSRCFVRSKRRFHVPPRASLSNVIQKISRPSL
jgi:hypothetical protein